VKTKTNPEFLSLLKTYPNKKNRFFPLFHKIKKLFFYHDGSKNKKGEKGLINNYLFGVNQEVDGIMVDLVAISCSTDLGAAGEEEEVAGFASLSPSCAIPILYII
jgi:hypothetical protein